MSDFAQRMAALAARFRVRAAEDEVAIGAALDPLDRPRLAHIAHGLAGIAGMFGADAVGAAALALEAAAEGDTPADEVRAEAKRLRALLRDGA